MNKLSFTDRVKNIVKNIPKGKTLSYKEVATYAGNPNASRAVGTIMKNNYDKDIPCHRVIRSDGKIGEYNRGGSQAKRTILIKEGVKLGLSF
jgi:methylated-DNA-[protein]-cysteine S-methyltransferase